MCVEEEQNVTQPTKKRKNGAKAGGGFLVVCLLAAAFFLLWGWISYRMRLSPEVIRAGITVWYVLPCFIGGRIARNAGKPASLIAAAYGGGFFCILYGCSCVQKQAWVPIEGEAMTVLILCVAAAVLGTLPPKKNTHR